LKETSFVFAKSRQGNVKKVKQLVMEIHSPLLSALPGLVAEFADATQIHV
jgi:hypothetical protein